MLAGVRYLARDRLLGPMTLTLIVLDGAANGFSVAVPLLAFTRYDREPARRGWIFTAFGVGAILGSVLVDEAARPRSQPLRLACVGIVAATLPLVDRRGAGVLAGRRASPCVALRPLRAARSTRRSMGIIIDAAAGRRSARR